MTDRYCSRCPTPEPVNLIPAAWMCVAIAIGICLGIAFVLMEG